MTQEFSNILTTSKRSPVKLESDGGAEFYNSTFQKFLKSENIQHYSRFTDKGPSTAERVFRTVRTSLKKPVFEKRKAGWLFEQPTYIEQYNNTIHNSTKMAPIQAGKKNTEKEVYSNLQDKRQKHTLNFKLGDLVRTIDIRRVFSKGDSTIAINYTQ